MGAGHFLVACKTDGHFISEDIREQKARRDQVGKEYEKTIANLNCLSLNYEQMRVLYSLEKLIIDDDIVVTADESAKKEKMKRNRYFCSSDDESSFRKRVRSQ